MAKPKSEFLSVAGVLWEILKGVFDEVKNLGGGDEAIRNVHADPGLRRRIAEIIVSASHDPACASGSDPLYPFTYRFPWWNEKCGVFREGAPSPAPLDFTKLELVPFHKEGETLVSGEEMLRRANDKEAFPGCQGWGMHQGDELYRRRAELPKEWVCDTGPAILLPDTEFLDEDGRRRIAYLFWFDGGWQFSWGWFSSGFNRHYHFLRLGK